MDESSGQVNLSSTTVPISHTATGNIISFNRNKIYTKGTGVVVAGKNGSNANTSDQTTNSNRSSNDASSGSSASGPVTKVSSNIIQSSTLLRQIIESDTSPTNLNQAFQIAKLGVDKNDWRYLAEKCLILSTDESFRIAASCYTQINDLIFLDIIDELSEKYLKSRKENSNLLCQAEACSYLGLFDEAVEAYRKAGKLNLARKMYLDLRMFDKAKD